MVSQKCTAAEHNSKKITYTPDATINNHMFLFIQLVHCLTKCYLWSFPSHCTLPSFTHYTQNRPFTKYIFSLTEFLIFQLFVYCLNYFVYNLMLKPLQNIIQHYIQQKHVFMNNLFCHSTKFIRLNMFLVFIVIHCI